MVKFFSLHFLSSMYFIKQKKKKKYNFFLVSYKKCYNLETISLADLLLIFILCSSPWFPPVSCSPMTARESYYLGSLWIYSVYCFSKYPNPLILLDLPFLILGEAWLNIHLHVIVVSCWTFLLSWHIFFSFFILLLLASNI